MNDDLNVSVETRVMLALTAALHEGFAQRYRLVSYNPEEAKYLFMQADIHETMLMLPEEAGAAISLGWKIEPIADAQDNRE